MFNVMEILSGELLLLNIEIPMGCDLMELKLVVLNVQNYGIKKEGVKMIKPCKVCGKEMDCYDKEKERSGRKNKKLAYNRITCSKDCSKRNVEIIREEYYHKPENIERLKEYGKKYRERKRDKKKAMQKEMV